MSSIDRLAAMVAGVCTVVLCVLLTGTVLHGVDQTRQTIQHQTGRVQP